MLLQKPQQTGIISSVMFLTTQWEITSSKSDRNARNVEISPSSFAQRFWRLLKLQHYESSGLVLSVIKENFFSLIILWSLCNEIMFFSDGWDFFWLLRFFLICRCCAKPLERSWADKSWCPREAELTVLEAMGSCLVPCPLSISAQEMTASLVWQWGQWVKNHRWGRLHKEFQDLQPAWKGLFLSLMFILLLFPLPPALVSGVSSLSWPESSGMQWGWMTASHLKDTFHQPGDLWMHVLNVSYDP